MSSLISSVKSLYGNTNPLHAVGGFLEVESRPLRDGSTNFVTTVTDMGTETVVGSYLTETLPQSLRFHAEALEGAVRYVEKGGSAADVRAMRMFFQDFETMCDYDTEPARF